jgi:hypothetical protein
MPDTDSTKSQQRGLIPFKPGQSGNPAGRPVGSRNKLAETFLADVLTEWETHGAAAISEMREKSAADFCKMVASLCPKEMTLNVNNEIEMTDDELRERIRSLAGYLAPFLAGNGSAGEGTEAQAIEAIATQVH